MSYPWCEDSDSTDPQAALLADLQLRARILLSELHTFQQLLQQCGKSDAVEIRKFNSTVETELKALDKVKASLGPSTAHRKTNSRSRSGQKGEPGGYDDEDSDREDVERQHQQVHALRSSNLPYYEAVWRTAKGCGGVRAVGKRFYFSAPSSGRVEGVDGELKLGNGQLARVPKDVNQQLSKKHVLVDIVAEDGLEWVKVSTVTEKRLLFELAKEGWASYRNDDGGSSDNDLPRVQSGSTLDTEQQEEAHPDLELVRLARDLAAASRQIRVRYRHPRIRLVLPKINEGRVKDIDRILNDIRATGAEVHAGSYDGTQMSPSTSNAKLDFSATDAPATSYESMLPGPSLTLTSRLNIDCTILLALISDISHLSRTNLPPSPNTHAGGTYHAAILHQIATEEHSPLLPGELYPLLDNRALECTDAAANRMREIVQTMGTKAEKTRAEIMLAEGAYADVDSGSLRASLATESGYSVPEGLRLPIRVVGFQVDDAFGDDESSVTLKSDSILSAAKRSQLATASVGRKTKLVARRLRRTFSGGLSAINSSVFVYGWLESIVTVTSNRAVAAGVERRVGEILDEFERDETHGGGGRGDGRLETSIKALKIADGNKPVAEREVDGTRLGGEKADEEKNNMEGMEGCEGPKIWMVETARSLIGKDKGRRDG